MAERHDRFMQDPPAIRLGGIAANLARIASFAGNPLNRQAVLDLTEESKWFIEWTAPLADVEVAARLAEIQVSLALTEMRLRGGRQDIGAMISAASDWSGELLEMSGLAR
jgi:hypothetical protein